LSFASSTSSTSSIPYNKPDRWVSASPIALTAVCQDGFAFVATHTAPKHEPLLMPYRNDSEVSKDEEFGNFEVETDKKIQSLKYPSLPSTYRGPLRIERVDGTGTCLISAGWRTDYILLTEKCRSIIATEVAKYGKSATMEYGRILAESVALWMAQCAFSLQVRDLSCVGLLACCHSDFSANNIDESHKFGSLWLVDATGAYRARAMAIGSGATIVNSRLCKIAFHEVTKEEGVRLLLKAITEVEEDVEEDIEEQELLNEKNILQEGTYIESAVMGFECKTLRRIPYPFDQSH